MQAFFRGDHKKHYVIRLSSLSRLDPALLGLAIGVYHGFLLSVNYGRALWQTWETTIGLEALLLSLMIILSACASGPQKPSNSVDSAQVQLEPDIGAVIALINGGAGMAIPETSMLASIFKKKLVTAIVTAVLAELTSFVRVSLRKSTKAITF